MGSLGLSAESKVELGGGLKRASAVGCGVVWGWLGIFGLFGLIEGAFCYKVCLQSDRKWTLVTCLEVDQLKWVCCGGFAAVGANKWYGG